MYIVFVLIMMRVYTLPLFAFRSMYYSARSFRKALKDVINSRRAIHHLNNSFPDATSEELTEADNVCIICREEMQSGKSLCTWILHFIKRLITSLIFLSVNFYKKKEWQPEKLNVINDRWLPTSQEVVCDWGFQQSHMNNITHLRWIYLSIFGDWWPRGFLASNYWVLTIT